MFRFIDGMSLMTKGSDSETKAYKDAISMAQLSVYKRNYTEDEIKNMTSKELKKYSKKQKAYVEELKRIRKAQVTEGKLLSKSKSKKNT